MDTVVDPLPAPEAEAEVAWLALGIPRPAALAPRVERNKVGRVGPRRPRPHQEPFTAGAVGVAAHLQLQSLQVAFLHMEVGAVEDAHPPSRVLVVRVYSVEKGATARLAPRATTEPNRAAVVVRRRKAVREALAKSA